VSENNGAHRRRRRPIEPTGDEAISTKTEVNSLVSLGIFLIELCFLSFKFFFDTPLIMNITFMQYLILMRSKVDMIPYFNENFPYIIKARISFLNIPFAFCRQFFNILQQSRRSHKYPVNKAAAGMIGKTIPAAIVVFGPHI